MDKECNHYAVYMAEYLVGTEKVGGYAYCKYCLKTLTAKELYDIIQKTRQPVTLLDRIRRIWIISGR